MKERAILVGLEWKGRAREPARKAFYTAEESLEELAELAGSAGAIIEEQILQARQTVEAATLIGRGKVQEIAALAQASEAGVVIFDHDLTPTQQRNLEEQLGVKVIDRTQLILDIFASRARTREGRLQVELAQLNYLLPRLTGRGTAMSRLGGGIGTRGPGETQLETDRRRIARRIRKVTEDLESVRAGRAVHRQKRNAVPLPTIALVGYTNAGKSTLFNRFTEAGVIADARMFATLDPTVRAISLPSRRRTLVSDTVGFIRNLPTTLVKAFRATLEEVAEATLILHVLDASSSHSAAQAVHVSEVLAEIGAEAIPQLLVLNKMDLLPKGSLEVEAIRRRWDHAVEISALDGRGVDRLLTVMDELLPFDPVVPGRFRIPMDQQSKLSMLHELGRVRQTRYQDGYVEVEADIAESLKRKLAPFAAK